MDPTVGLMYYLPRIFCGLFFFLFLLLLLVLDGEHFFPKRGCVDCFIEYELFLQQYYENRLRALAAQKAAEINPYPHKFEAKLTIPEYVKRYESLNSGDHLEDVEERIAGRRYM